jgi:light-harvesting complex I chlorophyll a/b binding protein 1
VGRAFARAGASPDAVATLLEERTEKALPRMATARMATATLDAQVPEEEGSPPPFDPAQQIGATYPLGFFDPVGFCKVGDEETFRNMRNAELKHGRVAMMASVGTLVQCGLQFPGFEKVPRGLGALSTEPGLYGFVALVLVSGALELTIWKDDPAKGVYGIGDYGNPAQLGMGEPMGLSDDMKNRELNNGRAAMFATLGIIAAELATGKNAWEQLG